MSIINSTPVRVIAIVGCDGSGKSTLTASLVNELAARMPTERIYLGQSSGRIGEWISQLPIIGAPFGRYLRSKAAHVHEKPSTPPGNITALVIYLLSCWRAYKFRKMLCKSQQGFLLITDRYPQVEVPGFRFDGPQLAKTTGGNGWIAERGENIQVWIDPVVFNDLLNWLNALDEKYALRVTQIDASAAEKTGMVNVQRLEFGRG